MNIKLFDAFEFYICSTADQGPRRIVEAGRAFKVE
jgi:hypothetical protein